MGETYLESVSTLNNVIRSLFSSLDKPFYGLLTILYQLFFNVASVDLFSEAMMKFFERVQLIIGVYMMFQLAMTILRGIIDPDNFTKTQGGSKGIIVRVMVALVMLALLVPVNTGGGNEFEKQINNQGLLFGTLSSLQHRILSNNTLGRLILGTDGTTGNYLATDSSNPQEELETSARIFTSTILKGFYRINLKPKEDRVHEDGKTDDMINDNRICTDMSDEFREAYTRLDADPGAIIDRVNEECITDYNPVNFIPLIDDIFGTKKYMLTYTPVLSTIVAIIFCVILLSFTVDVAVRSIKLAILRLLAPIPIISYMDPNGSKDSAFSAWGKTLVSTYLDLFVRLASVYFVIFLIQDMIVNGVVINNVDGIIGIFSWILIWIGLFMFAKQAPKFIREILGIKGDGGNFFSGFGAIGAAAGLGVAAIGGIGSGIASFRGSKMADETRASLGEKDIFGRKVNPKGIFNRGKHLVAGLTGGFAGAAAGATAAAKAKDHAFSASMDAMRKRNASAISRGNDGSTLLGTWGSTAANIFTGEGQAAATEREISSNKGRLDALKAVKSRVSGEMVKKDWTSGKLGIQDASGRDITANYKEFMAAYESAKASGSGAVTFTNQATGSSETITMKQAELQKGYLLKNNEDDYLVKNLTGGTPAGQVDDRLLTLVHNVEVLGGSAQFTRNADGTVTKGNNVHITNRDSVTDAIDGFEDYNTQLTRQNSINKANDRHSGDKK